MHEDLLTTCTKVLRTDGMGKIYLTFQHHNEHAPAFFVMAREKFGMIDKKLATIGWGGRNVDEFDLEDGDLMGPIYLHEMNFIK